MMAAAQTAAVGRVELGATVLDLDDVVGEQPMLWRGEVAAPAVLHPFAAEPGLTQDLVPPGQMFGHLVVGVGHLGGGPCRSRIQPTNRRPKGLQPRRFQCAIVTLTARGPLPFGLGSISKAT